MKRMLMNTPQDRKPLLARPSSAEADGKPLQCGSRSNLIVGYHCIGPRLGLCRLDMCIGRPTPFGRRRCLRDYIWIGDFISGFHLQNERTVLGFDDEVRLIGLSGTVLDLELASAWLDPFLDGKLGIN